MARPRTEPICDPAHRPLEAARAHGHAHAHGAGEHRPAQRRALALCITLTLAMMAVEFVGAWWTKSLMLLSDAAHMFSHAAALGISYLALRLATKQWGERSHFGLYRTEILGALLNGVGVLLLTAWIVWEAVQRFLAPEAIHGGEMTLIALLGLAVNVVTAILLGRAGAEDLNTKSAFLHMLGDTLSSVAIAVGGLVVWKTGWQWIDPLLSLLIALLIAVWGLRLVRHSCGILLEIAPEGSDPATVREAVVEHFADVHDVHDLHVWEITSGYVCLTAHVVTHDVALSETQALHERIRRLLRERFHIAHVTLQMEAEHAPASAH